jgi:hypothetical protein
MSERDFDNGPSDRQSNRPVETLRDGALKLSIFRNQNEHGDSYAMIPGRIYTDKQSGQVRETHSLGGGEALRMAHLLTKGHDRVAELRAQMKEGRSSSHSRDTSRER